MAHDADACGAVGQLGQGRRQALPGGPLVVGGGRRVEDRAAYGGSVPIGAHHDVGLVALACGVDRGHAVGVDLDVHDLARELHRHPLRQVLDQAVPWH
jgi:hypothetical protein